MHEGGKGRKENERDNDQENQRETERETESGGAAKSQRVVMHMEPSQLGKRVGSLPILPTKLAHPRQQHVLSPTDTQDYPSDV